MQEVEEMGIHKTQGRVAGGFLPRVIPGALIRVTLALAVIVTTLFTPSLQGGEALALTRLIRGVARESAIDRARNTPSQAFIAMLQAAYVATGVEIDGPTAIRAWQAAYRPRLGTYYAMEEAYVRVMRACGIKDYDCVQVMSEREIMLDPVFLEGLFKRGMVMVAFFGNDGGQNIAQAQRTSSMLNKLGLPGFGDIARAEQYRVIETALAVIGMTEEGDTVVLDGKGRPASLKVKDLETCRFVMGVMGVNLHDRSNLNGERITSLLTGPPAEEGGEKQTKRESKVSPESEDYLKKIRNEIK